MAGFICVWRFWRAWALRKTCRIVTTSVAEHHLNVLWGEVGRFVTSCSPAFPLLAKDGGPFTMNYMEMRRLEEMASKNPLNYCVGRVSAKGEGLAGHHAEDTLFIADEASGVDDKSYQMAQGWAKKMFLFGNPNQCTNFWYRGVKAGDLMEVEGTP